MEKTEKKEPAQEVIIAEIERWVKQVGVQKRDENPQAINILCLLIAVLCGILRKIIILPEEDIQKVIDKLKMVQSLPECAILVKNWEKRKLQNHIQQTIEDLEKSIPNIPLELEPQRSS